MDAELILNDIRFWTINSAKKLDVDVVYCEYDFETGKWHLELKMEQTLPPNRNNTSDVKVVESVANRVRVVVEHDLADPENTSDKILRKIEKVLAEVNTVGRITLSHAKNNRIQHGG